MQIAVFTIPITDSTDEVEACNSFLGSVRVLIIKREFVADGANSFWTIFVEYLEHVLSAKTTKKRQVDYKEILSPEDFIVFDRLRKQRKVLAERNGVPVYAVFTNEQLADIATRRMLTIGELMSLDGVGKNKIEKFASILDAVQGNKESETSS